jgi:hypothetical protein
MNAMLIIKTGNGYACAPYTGPVPDNFVQEMSVATELKSYSYSPDTVLSALKAHFEPTLEKTPAPAAPATSEEPL